MFRHGELAAIDPAARQIILADGARLGYDYLILATGATAAYHGVPGAAEYSLGLYTRQDAIVLRDRIMTGLEQLSLAGQRGDVRVTVIGGRATGVELAGSIADLRNIALATSYPEIDRDRVHVALIEQAPELSGLPPHAAQIHPPAADQAWREHAARHRHPQDHPQPGRSGRRHRPAQRHHGVGGGRGSAGRGRPVGPAGRAWRTAPRRPRPARRRARPHLRGR